MNKLETLKCVEVTSQRQADNGTISYFDPQTKAYYNLYENGYVRRSFGRHRRPDGKLGDEIIYQLNPQRKGEYVSPWTGDVHDTTERVMLETHEERMECAARSVINYRNTIELREFERADRQNKNERRIAMMVIQDSVNQFFEGNVDFYTAIEEINQTLTDIKFKGLA